MAKKTIKKEGQLPDVLSLIRKFDDDADIIENAETSKLTDAVSTGSLILDAAISGHITGSLSGVYAGKILLLSGEPQTGKSFLCCSICRQAQKKGYNCIYIDSEGAITPEGLTRLGIDTKKLILKQVNNIAEMSSFVTNLLDQLDKQREEYGECQKVAIFIDSISNMSSTKEQSDALNQTGKKDFSKQSELKAFARLVSLPIARNHVLSVWVSHVYQSLDMFKPGSQISGGQGIQYAASTTLMLSQAKLNDKQSDDIASKKAGNEDALKNGVLVTAKVAKSRFTIPHRVRFPISFYRPMEATKYVGLESYMTWDNAGVARGSMLTQKEYDKLSPTDKEKAKTWENNGQTYYAILKDTARGIVVRHLNKTVAPLDFFTDEVFTPEYLQELDEKVFAPTFLLPDANSMDDLKEIEDLIEIGDESDTNE